MRYDDALHVLTDRAMRDDGPLVQAARIVLTAPDADEAEKTLARSVLADVRRRMWEAEAQARAGAIDPVTAPWGAPPAVPAPPQVAIGDRGWRKAKTVLARYKFILVDLSVVAAAGLFVLYLGLTINMFRDTPGFPQAAETLEFDEMLLLAAVVLGGSLWAIRRLLHDHRRLARP